jgi:PAS domain S-box-containing protein
MALEGIQRAVKWGRRSRIEGINWSPPPLQNNSSLVSVGRAGLVPQVRLAHPAPLTILRNTIVPCCRNGRRSGVLSVFRDITGRKELEKALRQTEEKLRLLLEGVKDYAIFMLDSKGRVLSWNAGAERINGYRAEEIIGKHFSIFFAPEDIKGAKPEESLSLAAEKGRYELQGWRVRKDGSRYWADIVVSAIRDESGNLRGFAKVTRDMTERKQAEEVLKKTNEELDLRVQRRTEELAKANQELQAEINERRRAEAKLRSSFEQLRALAARLQRVREEERTMIAREIHDELGQALTAMKMDVAWLLQKLPEADTPLRERMQSTLRLVDDTIKTVRRIASDLRPGLLDDLGLAAAIEWQAQDFQSRTGIRCQVTLPREEIRLDPDRSTAIFRIFQETLTNVARHADASSVDVRFALRNKFLILEVQDNGIGIEPSVTGDTRSLGLLGMRERAQILGGEFEVSGSPGKGTTVTLRIPVERRRTESGVKIQVPAERRNKRIDEEV